MAVGKTYKDLREFDKNRNKEASRKAFKDADMRTRVKPLEKKERGGGKNWRNELDNWLEDEHDNEDESLLQHMEE